jgi:hypothetical protein
MAEKDFNAELKAMAAMMEVLNPLERDMQVGALQWVIKRLGLPDYLPEVGGQGGVGAENETASFGSSGSVPSGGPVRAGSINTVAMKLGADSCRTLLISAAVHLTLYQGKEAFTRSELTSLARSAKAWKSDYTNQTSTMIGRLVDGEVLVEKSKDLYFVADRALEDYAARLGG